MKDENGNSCPLCGGQLKETDSNFSMGGDILPIPKKKNVWEEVEKYSKHNYPTKIGGLTHQCDKCGAIQPEPT